VGAPAAWICVRIGKKLSGLSGSIVTVMQPTEAIRWKSAPRQSKSRLNMGQSYNRIQAVGRHPYVIHFKVGENFGEAQQFGLAKIYKFQLRHRVSDLILRFLRIRRVPLRSGQSDGLFGRDSPKSWALIAVSDLHADN